MKARKLYCATVIDAFGKFYNLHAEAECFEDAYIAFLNEVETINSFGKLDIEIVDIHKERWVKG